jgi:lipid A ethanolaminephosphotransferase
MNSYSIVIDHTMIQNVVETNMSESMDLVGTKLILIFLLTGILPAILVYKVKVQYRPFKKLLLTRFLTSVGAVLIIAVMLFSFSKSYASFLREHKRLRHHTNPTYFLFSIFKYADKHIPRGKTTLKLVETDAKIPPTDMDRELIILVIGEAARADRFSLNGYDRETNPLLKREDVINFPDMHSCGTTTSVSVPCMFSFMTRKNFDDKEARSTENVIDVLAHAGVHILWRDNNSSSKGVASRVQYEDYRHPDANPVCDVECRDEGMLEGLQEYVDSQKSGDILIVLHQMGNHGPAYFKRYPKSFEVFTPVCETNELAECTEEEIGNSYDNALLYTDYFLSKVIHLLKQNGHFEAAMIYVSDHGESLGEGNLYLHGSPYFLAPEAQKHVAALMWFGDGFKIHRDAIRQIASKPYSHDNIPHTLLGLMEIDSAVYDRNLDILHEGRME